MSSSTTRLRDHDPEFLASTFAEMATVVQGVPDDVGMPPDERKATGRSPLASCCMSRQVMS